jgi:hypothetical protein
MQSRGATKRRVVSSSDSKRYSSSVITVGVYVAVVSTRISSSNGVCNCHIRSSGDHSSSGHAVVVIVMLG